MKSLVNLLFCFVCFYPQESWCQTVGVAVKETLFSPRLWGKTETKMTTLEVALKTPAGILLQGRCSYQIAFYPLVIVGLKEQNALGLKQEKRIIGFGLSPIGLHLESKIADKIKLSACWRGGFLFFTDEIPKSGEKRYKLMSEQEIALLHQLNNKWGLGWMVGYRHLSNGHGRKSNTGSDHFFVGLLVTR